MSLPKKGSRKITIESIVYLWKANSNGQGVNLTIAPIENGQKIKAFFDFDTENIGSNFFKNPFIITPYVTREVIIYAIKNGYAVNGKSTEMNLGNLTKILVLDLSEERKVNRLIQNIESRISSVQLNSNENEMLQSTLKTTKGLVQVGECFIGFEILVSNLGEINFKLEKSELILIKEIFRIAKVDWRKDWNWIEDLKK